MIRVITRIKDLKLHVFHEKIHDFRSKKKMQEYKQNLLDTIDDQDVIVTFTTYVKEL